MMNASSPFASSNGKIITPARNGKCFDHFCVTTAERIRLKERAIKMRLSCLCGGEVRCGLGKVTTNVDCGPSFRPRLELVTRCSSGSFTLNTACLLFGRLRTRIRLREVGCFANKLAFRFHLSKGSKVGGRGQGGRLGRGVGWRRGWGDGVIFAISEHDHLDLDTSGETLL